MQWLTGSTQNPIHEPKPPYAAPPLAPPPTNPLQVPPEIQRPDYALDGIPKMKPPPLPWNIEVKNSQDIAGMKAAGRIARYPRNER